MVSGGGDSTSPISMRGASSSKKQRGGLFKGWKKNNSKSSSSAAAAVGGDNQSFQRNRVAIDPQQQQHHNNNNNNWHDDEQSPHRIHHRGQGGALQFTPTNNYVKIRHHQRIPPQQQQFRPPSSYTKQLANPTSNQQIQQKYPTHDEYYHCCNDELSRQLQLAAQVDKQLNEEKRLAKFRFREMHCRPQPPSIPQSQLQQQSQQHHHPKQQQGLTLKLQHGNNHGISHPKEDLMTQSTQATKDTASSVASSSLNVSSHASSITNTNNNNNIIGGEEEITTPVTNALSTAAQVFHQQRSNNYTAAGGSGDTEYVKNALSTAAQVFHQQRNNNYTAAGGGSGGTAFGGSGGDTEYVKEWKIMSDSFQQPGTSGEEGSELDWPDDDDDDEVVVAAAPPPPQNKEVIQGRSVWREAIDRNSGKTYYYNILTKEVSWTIPNDDESGTPPPPPPSKKDDDAIILANNNAPMNMPKTPHRNNTSSMQHHKQQQRRQQQQQQQQQKQQKLQRGVYSKSPPRARASPSLDSIAEDDDYYHDEEAVDHDDDEEEEEGDVDNTNDAIALTPPSEQQQAGRRTRSKSPFRVISSKTRSRSPVLRHASSSFHSDPNRGGDANGATAADDDGGGRKRSVSPFRVFNTTKQTTKNKKKGSRRPVVNRMPSQIQQQGKGSAEVGDVVSLVSYYDDPSIGVLSSLDDTMTMASRFSSLSRKSSSMAAAPSASDVNNAASGGGGGGSSSSGRRDASQTPPRNKKQHADPPGNSIDEILKKGVSSRSSGGVGKNYEEYSPYGRDPHSHSSPYRRERYQQQQQQQQQLPDPSPVRESRQQHPQHSPFQQHQSPYSGQSPQKHPQQRSPYKHQQGSPYKHHQQQQQQQQHHDPPYMEELREHQSPYSEQHQQYLEQPQIYVDEDGNQWMVTPQEVPGHRSSLQPRSSQQQLHSHRQQHDPRQIYYDEEGQPYYYEDDEYGHEEEYDPEQEYQQLQHQEYPVPPSQLQTPRQGWQWSEQQGPNHPNQYQQEEEDYPAEEYFDDGNGNFISFITTDTDEGDHHLLGDYESIGMLTGDEEGPPLEGQSTVPADDDTAANTLNTVDLVAEVKRVWRHVQRYEQKKSTKTTDRRIEKKDSEEELLVHQFTQAFAQASPGRASKSSAGASMTKSSVGASTTKSSAAGVSTITSSTTQRPASDAAQISPEKEVVPSSGRGRSRSKDSRLGEHIRSTSVHSRALSSRGESPVTGSDNAMMSRGDTEMDGAFISEGMDDFFLSPGKPQKSTLKQQAKQKQHLLHPSQVAAAQKLMQNNKATIAAAAAASAAPKSSKVPTGGQQHDLASPYDFTKVKSTGTNFSQKTQTISNTTTSDVAMKAHKLEMARKHKELANRSRSPPRPPPSRNNNNIVQMQIQQREEERFNSPGGLYARALKNAKDRKIQREQINVT